MRVSARDDLNISDSCRLHVQPLKAKEQDHTFDPITKSRTIGWPEYKWMSKKNTENVEHHKVIKSYNGKAQVK